MISKEYAVYVIAVVTGISACSSERASKPAPPTEAVSPAGEDFGEVRLAELVGMMREKPASEIVEAIHVAVATFTEGAPAADDITVVIARRV